MEEFLSILVAVFCCVCGFVFMVRAARRTSVIPGEAHQQVAAPEQPTGNCNSHDDDRSAFVPPQTVVRKSDEPQAPLIVGTRIVPMDNENALCHVGLPWRRYVQYAIRISGGHTIWRRYTDFQRLEADVRRELGGSLALRVALPPKCRVWWKNLQPDVIGARRKALNRFLHFIYSADVASNTAAARAFLELDHASPQSSASLAAEGAAASLLHDDSLSAVRRNSTVDMMPVEPNVDLPAHLPAPPKHIHSSLVVDIARVMPLLRQANLAPFQVSDHEMKICRNLLSPSAADSWNQVYADENLNISTQQDPVQGTMSVRATIHLDATTRDAYNAMFSPAERTRWDNYMKEVHVAQTFENGTEVRYEVYDWPRPMWPRDNVSRFRCVEQAGVLWVFCETVNDSCIPCTHSHVRCWGRSVCSISADHTSGGCVIRRITEANPNGGIPSWVVSRTAANASKSWMRKLQKAMIEYQPP